MMVARRLPAPGCSTACFVVFFKQHGSRNRSFRSRAKAGRPGRTRTHRLKSPLQPEPAVSGILAVHCRGCAPRGNGPPAREIIGTEVFGRDATYDTNADPIVRMTAAEVRKRIAQYYRETGRDDQTQIEVRAGSYVPVFTFPAQPKLTADVCQGIEIGPSKHLDVTGISSNATRLNNPQALLKLPQSASAREESITGLLSL